MPSPVTLVTLAPAESGAALEERYGAHNYASLPVDLVHGEGVWLWDKRGRRYLDLMSAYSAVSHGHSHPRLVTAAREQIGKLAVVSRAFHSEWLGPFLEKACTLTGMDRALPMNSGAEAVETAIKAARKWATLVKGIPEGQAEILVMENNFHGRTTTIVGFSSNAQYREGFGPGDHGSTFGGNPLAARVGLEALNVLVDENLAERSRDLGDYFLEQLRAIHHPAIHEIRGRGLFIGLELDPAWGTATDFCHALLKHAALSKDTREQVVRLTPPLVISRAEIDLALQKIRATFENLEPAATASQGVQAELAHAATQGR